MNITEHEMRGLLTGKCIPGDMLVNEELSAYLVRKFTELKAECDALAADRERFAVQCAAAKIAVQHAKSRGFECTLNTPAVDAYLNSVRAEASIDILSELLEELSAKGKGASRHRLGFIDYAWAVVAEKRANHSNQLRAGEPS